MLQALGSDAGVRVTLVKACEVDGKPVSTSRVRENSRPAMSPLRKLLGRPFRVIGTSARGESGHSLGFPTANLQGVATLVPGGGVYAVRVLHEGKTWPGAANIGANPTFGENAAKIEVHLIGYQGDLYGETLQVDFYERIRNTRRPFAGVAELVEQLRKDVERAAAVVA